MKKIKKKGKTLKDPLDEVVVEIEFEDDSDQSPLLNDSIGFDSPPSIPDQTSVIPPKVPIVNPFRRRFELQ